MLDFNNKIKARILYTGFDEATYFNRELFAFAVKNKDDPDILFKIKILGSYAKKYKWTTEQAWEFIEMNLEESRGHYVGEQFYEYDWGSGENKIKPIDKMHEPNLDHIKTKESGGSDSHENMRIRSRRLNENKNNTNTDEERLATVLDFIKDFENKELLNGVKEAIDRQMLNDD